MGERNRAFRCRNALWLRLVTTSSPGCQPERGTFLLAGVELNLVQSSLPGRRAGRQQVFLEIPHCAIVSGIQRHVGVVAPTVAASSLRAGACSQPGLSAQLAYLIARSASGNVD